MNSIYELCISILSLILYKEHNSLDVNLYVTFSYAKIASMLLLKFFLFQIMIFLTFSSSIYIQFFFSFFPLDDDKNIWLFQFLVVIDAFLLNFFPFFEINIIKCSRFELCMLSHWTFFSFSIFFAINVIKCSMCEMCWEFDSQWSSVPKSITLSWYILSHRILSWNSATLCGWECIKTKEKGNLYESLPTCSHQ